MTSYSISLFYSNIRSITSSLSGLESERYALEYGDASWTDRLTKVTYTDGNGNTEDGIRQSKTVNGSTTKFITLDGRVLDEK